MTDETPDRPCTVITGASGKLGRQFLRALLAAGHNVVATTRRAGSLADEVAAAGGRLTEVAGNLVGGEALHLASDIQERGLRPTGLVNNAVDLSNQALPKGDGVPTYEQWIKGFDLSVVAPFDLVRGLADAPGSRLKRVVNISSMYAIVPRNPHLYTDPGSQSPIHYGVAKAAMLFLTKELAVRLAPRGIQVNAISYGGVEGRVDNEFKRRYAQLCPLGRMLGDEEVSGALLFLLSDAAAGMVGHNLVVDGGWTVW